MGSIFFSKFSLLKVGDLLDARDTQNKWFGAIIVELTSPSDGERDKLKVHYCGWSSRWGVWFPRHAEQIQPLFSQTENWRDLKIGDRAEINGAQPNEKPRWFEAEVAGDRAW